MSIAKKYTRSNYDSLLYVDDTLYKVVWFSPHYYLIYNESDFRIDNGCIVGSLKEYIADNNGNFIQYPALNMISCG